MPLVDTLGRQIDYLRVSVTDHCNLDCLYCTPLAGACKLEHAEILSYEEILRVVRAAAAAGISNVRITGGEPLVRKGVVGLCRMLSGIGGLNPLAMTTNGVRLKELARPLFEAGVQRINVSLDTLRPERYARVTGHPFLRQVLAGIEEAEAVGFRPIKLNTVVMRGVNADEVADLARLTLEKPFEVRFIELMPTNGWSPAEHAARFVPLAEIVRMVEAVGPLREEPGRSGSFGPARLFSLPQAPGKVGFIAPLSRHFCGSCNRLRLTADGKLRPCLFSEDEIDLKTPLREGAAKEELQAIFRVALLRKPGGHALQLSHGLNGGERSMRAIGG